MPQRNSKRRPKKNPKPKVRKADEPKPSSSVPSGTPALGRSKLKIKSRSTGTIEIRETQAESLLWVPLQASDQELLPAAPSPSYICLSKHPGITYEQSDTPIIPRTPRPLQKEKVPQPFPSSNIGPPPGFSRLNQGHLQWMLPWLDEHEKPKPLTYEELQQKWDIEAFLEVGSPCYIPVEPSYDPYSYDYDEYLQVVNVPQPPGYEYYLRSILQRAEYMSRYREIVTQEVILQMMREANYPLWYPTVQPYPPPEVYEGYASVGSTIQITEWESQQLIKEYYNSGLALFQPHVQIRMEIMKFLADKMDFDGPMHPNHPEFFKFDPLEYRIQLQGAIEGNPNAKWLFYIEIGTAGYPDVERSQLDAIADWRAFYVLRNDYFARIYGIMVFLEKYEPPPEIEVEEIEKYSTCLGTPILSEDEDYSGGLEIDSSLSSLSLSSISLTELFSEE